MRRGKSVAALVIVGSVGAAILWRRRRRRRERVDLYFADGSMVSLEEGALEADRLLPHARAVLGVARAGR